jgi:hypothetical protein
MVNLRLSLLLSTLAAAAFVGCFAQTGSDGFGSDPNGNDPNGNGDPDGAAPTLDDAGKPAATGVPCAIETTLSTYCWSCHGVTPSAPSRLVTYGDLTAPSVANGSVSEAEEALTRMKASTSPMPPSGPKPSAWVSASTPKGAKCGGTGSDAGASIPEDAAPPPNPYNTPLQCTSNKKWTSGTGSTMRPGDACGRCHNINIAGTVYPTAHEPTNCYGIAGGSTVVVTDAKNKTVNITVNSAGNFLYSSSTVLTAPYTVKVISGSKTRAMSAKAPNGDCNSCHTATGSQSAPGRIMAP